MGPVLTGSGYYLKRKALYGSPDQEGALLYLTIVLLDCLVVLVCVCACVNTLYSATKKINCCDQILISINPMLRVLVIQTCSLHQSMKLWGRQKPQQRSCYMRHIYWQVAALRREQNGVLRSVTTVNLHIYFHDFLILRSDLF